MSTRVLLTFPTTDSSGPASRASEDSEDASLSAAVSDDLARLARKRLAAAEPGMAAAEPGMAGAAAGAAKRPRLAAVPLAVAAAAPVTGATGKPLVIGRLVSGQGSRALVRGSVPVPLTRHVALKWIQGHLFLTLEPGCPDAVWLSGVQVRSHTARQPVFGTDSIRIGTDQLYRIDMLPPSADESL
jgi:hypothetical protein